MQARVLSALFASLCDRAAPARQLHVKFVHVLLCRCCWDAGCAWRVLIVMLRRVLLFRCLWCCRGRALVMIESLPRGSPAHVRMYGARATWPMSGRAQVAEATCPGTCYPPHGVVGAGVVAAYRVCRFR